MADDEPPNRNGGRGINRATQLVGRVQPKPSVRAPTLPPADGEAVRRALAQVRAMKDDQPATPGYRLYWFRGEQEGWADVRLEAGAYAVVGRHTECDVRLLHDPEVSLRHLLVSCSVLDDGATGLRFVDLKTAHGFALEDDTPRRSIFATGVVGLRVGRYVLVAMPMGLDRGVELPIAPPVIESADVPPRTSTGPGAPYASRITVLPFPRELLETSPSVDMTPRAPAGHFRITLRSGARTATLELPDRELDVGVLVGRAEKCADVLRPLVTNGVSRSHVLVLRDASGTWGYDLCSLQGTFQNGARVRRAPMPDSGTTLRLATGSDAVELHWHARG